MKSLKARTLSHCPLQTLEGAEGQMGVRFVLANGPMFVPWLPIWPKHLSNRKADTNILELRHFSSCPKENGSGTRKTSGTNVRGSGSKAVCSTVDPKSSGSACQGKAWCGPCAKPLPLLPCVLSFHVKGQVLRFPKEIKKNQRQSQH